MGKEDGPTPGSGREGFLRWPGWDLFAYASLLSLAVALWWLLVYGGADWLTGLRDFRVRVHLDAELAIPFVPATVLLYLSIDLVFLLAPFVLRSRRELEALALTLAGETAVAGVCFLLLPAEPAYPLSERAGVWEPFFVLVRNTALRYNMVPSLHVALGCSCLAAYGRHVGRAGKALLGAWAAAIALSTLLTHQHHLLDVAAGFLLAAAAMRFIYARYAAPASAPQTPRANPSGGPAPLA